MSDRKVKVGVVGVGSLGQHHARVYAELDQAELVGVYDLNEKQARSVAKKNKTTVYPTIEELAEQVEALSIVVPTDLHREVAGKLIEKGIHLLVEKPITATTAEAEELVGLSQKNKVILQVGHIERFNPVLGPIEQWNTQPRFIESHRLAPYPPPRPGLRPRGTEVSVILDLMIHDLEIILHLVGSPVKDIRAVGVPVLSPTEDIANVRLLFESGCVANVTASRISPEKMRKIRVFFEDAYVSLDYQNQSGEVYRKDGEKITRNKIPIEKGEPLAIELRSFVSCVDGRDKPVVPAEHAAEALRLAAEITRRVREGAT